MLELELRRIEADRLRFAEYLTWVLERQYGESHGIRRTGPGPFTANEILAKALEIEPVAQPVSVWLLHFAAHFETNDRDAERARSRAFAYYRR